MSDRVALLTGYAKRLEIPLLRVWLNWGRPQRAARISQRLAPVIGSRLLLSETLGGKASRGGSKRVIFEGRMYNSRLHFHFTGIGGSGMSGIAEILMTLGFQVSGSDMKASETTRMLERLGAEVSIGHDAQNLPAGASLLVYSSAVDATNPEMVEAHRRGIPVVRRAEVLAELMRLKYGVAVGGSHGKTTTTSLCAAVLERGGLDPTVVIGGQLKARDSGSRVGKSEFLVAETDESDRSFLLMKPTIAVVTNIDSEHLSAYASLTDLEQSFKTFVESVPFYGLAVLCVDDHRVRELARLYTKRKVTYGYSPDAELQPRIIEQSPSGTTFEVWRGGERLLGTHLPMLGRHLVLNCVAAVAVGLEFEIPVQAIEEAIASFSGVKRRLEVIGEHSGVTVISDYGHHPTEIRATLQAVREGWRDHMRQLHVVFQPHRYSRTKECFVEFLDAFQDADHVIATEIYAASEQPIPGISGKALCDAIVHGRKHFVSDVKGVPDFLIPKLQAGDLVLCLGAGSIGSLPEQIMAALPQLQSPHLKKVVGGA